MESKIYERVKKYADENGIKQTIISQRTGIDDSKVSDLLAGKRKLSADEFEFICKEGLLVNPALFFEKRVLETKRKD